MFEWRDDDCRDGKMQCLKVEWLASPPMAQQCGLTQLTLNPISTRKIDLSLTSSGTDTAERSRTYGVLNCTVFMGFHLVFYICVYSEWLFDWKKITITFNLQVYFADDAPLIFLKHTWKPPSALLEGADEKSSCAVASIYSFRKHHLFFFLLLFFCRLSAK